MRHIVHVLVIVLLASCGTAPIPTPDADATQQAQDPDQCVAPKSPAMTCTLSASATKVKVGDTVRLTLAFSTPTRSDTGVGAFTHSLIQSPLLFASEYYGFSEHSLDEQLAPRNVTVSSCETYDLLAVQAGQVVIKGKIIYEVYSSQTQSFFWADCHAGAVEILVEP